MSYENTFKVSLIISFLIHGFILYQLPSLNTTRLTKSLQEIEVTYYKLQMLKLKTEDSRHTTVKNPVKQTLTLKKEKMPSPVSRDVASFFKKFQTPQKAQIAVKQIQPQKKISIPEVKTDNKVKNPKYNDYSHKIRQDIRGRLYQNYSRYDTGEVYTVFVVLSDGTLKDVKIMDEKSKAENYLKEIAIRSVKQAAPFPAFPQGLSYPELTFNVIISFEVSE